MRKMISSILIALGCLLAPLTLVAFWTANEVADPGGYLRNMAPLARHPDVRDAVTGRVADEITLRLRELGVAAEEGLVHNAVGDQVDDDFVTAWVETNRLAHRRFVAVLSADSGIPSSIGYDLAPMYELVKHRLRSGGLEAASRLPRTHPVAEVLPASAVAKIDHIHDRLISLRWVLAGTSPALIAAGVFLARDRCTALIGAGIGMAGSMFTLAIAMSALRNIYLPDSTSPGGLPVAAVLVIFDALTAFLRNGLRVLFTLGLLMAGVVFVARNGLIRYQAAAAMFESRAHQSEEPTNDVADGR
ncbi:MULTISPECIES: hypothetical protein [unclassified Streptosporangium]|uniref:hypothetical protein n=1 Tax=Streptosporangium sp. NPDC005286 TaxID=3154463 RepID=UPI00339F74EB